MQKLMGAVLLGLCAGGYSLLWSRLDAHGQGIFIFFSLMTAVTAARIGREAR